MAVADTPATWQEAFESHPIPVIRVIEKQLQAGLIRDKEKLRALVGGNYREVLLTADEIILLDRATKQTELEIATLSQRCKPPQFANRHKNVPVWTGRAAQLHLLSRCILYGGQAIKSTSILLGAELTLISRLLLKSLREESDSRQAVEKMQVRATMLRKQLLRLIDARLSHPASSIQAMIEAVSAYCLVTSASSSDAIKHFRELRMDLLKRRCSEEFSHRQETRETFRYLIASVQSLKSLLGRGVNEQLSSLQLSPVIESSRVVRLEALGIDHVRSLIPSEILTFTPFVKRVSMNKDEISNIVDAWSTEASQIFTKGLSSALHRLTTVREVFLLRKDLLTTILPVYFVTNARDVLVKSIRQSTNARALQIGEEKVQSLLLIGRDMIEQSVQQHRVLSPWEDSFVHTSFGDDSTSYAMQLQARHLGVSGSLDRSIKKMLRWARTYRQLCEQVQSLRLIRWQDIVEEPDYENESVVAVITSQLAKEDPQTFEAAMEEMLRTAITNFEDLVEKSVKAALEDETINIGRIVFLLRAARESAGVINSVAAESQIRQPAIYADLHKALAREVTHRISAEFESQKPTVRGSSSPIDNLPSPLTFSVLRRTCAIMQDIGNVDIWSRGAVDALKDELPNTFFQSDRKDAFIVNDFDEQYLRAALQKAGDSSTDSASAAQIRTNAIAYWERTKMLFGILC